MPDPGLTVVIPVGPERRHALYVQDAIGSAYEQLRKNDRILLIDDMHGLQISGVNVGVWRTPWHLGVAHAFNAGVALAQTEMVILLGADDELLEGCIEACRDTYYRNNGAAGYYWLSVDYSDGRGVQALPCGAAMVTKSLWRETGGFPTEAAVGASDAALVSILMVHRPDALIPVRQDQPLYWYRVHEESDTAERGPWQAAILETRNVATATWKAPQWGRYE